MVAVSTLHTTRCLWTQSSPAHNNHNEKQVKEAPSLNASKNKAKTRQKGGAPESSEKLERGTELESETGREVGLGEERQAAAVDLVVPENLHQCNAM